MLADKVSFVVDVKGETTGRRFEGLFEVKTKLSVRETLLEDEIRRNALGINPQTAGDYAALIAAAIAYLKVRVTNAPDWWTKEAGGGLDLQDENVLVEVNNTAVNAVQKERDRLAKAAEEARAELKKSAPGAEE